MHPPPTTADTDTDHYAILHLPSPLTGTTASTSEIKAAFRRALLQQHPDKTPDQLLHSAHQNPNPPTGSVKPLSASRTSASASSVDVDRICLARDVLTDPVRRREYDHAVLLSRRGKAKGAQGVSGAAAREHPTELDTVDLDDMVYCAETRTWTRGCRCGNAGAYEVTEADLETAAVCGSSDVLVGCEGCSLHVWVVFEALDDEA